MERCSAFCAVVIGLLGMAGGARTCLRAQEAPGPKPAARERFIGEVLSIDKGTKQLTVKSDAGEVAAVSTDESTRCLHVLPGEKDLSKATPIQFGDVQTGDRVYARGKFSEDRKKIVAALLVVMDKEDLERKHEGERAEWRQRGVAGTISALTPATGEIVCSRRTFQGSKELVIKTSATTSFRRYARDSVKFSDAKSSAFSELHVGDQLRVLGQKSEDGTQVQAEQVVSGTFHNLLGKVASVGPAAGAIVVTELRTNRKLNLRIGPDATLRRIPPSMATMMAQRMAGGPGGMPGPNAGASGGQRPGTPPGPSGVRPPGNAPPQGNASPQGMPGGPSAGMPPGGMMRNGGEPDFAQLLERMPPITAADLKPGDGIVFLTSSIEEGEGPLTVVTLVAGLETMFAQMPTGGSQGASPLGGMWSLDIGTP